MPSKCHLSRVSFAKHEFANERINIDERHQLLSQLGYNKKILNYIISPMYVMLNLDILCENFSPINMSPRVYNFYYNNNYRVGLFQNERYNLFKSFPVSILTR